MQSQHIQVPFDNQGPLRLLDGGDRLQKSVQQPPLVKEQGGGGIEILGWLLGERSCTKPVHRASAVANGKDEPTAHQGKPVTVLLPQQPKLLGCVRVELMLRQRGQQEDGVVRMEAEAKAASGVLSDTPLLEVQTCWFSDLMP